MEMVSNNNHIIFFITYIKIVILNFCPELAEGLFHDLLYYLNLLWKKMYDLIIWFYFF